MENRPESFDKKHQEAETDIVQADSAEERAGGAQGIIPVRRGTGFHRYDIIRIRRPMIARRFLKNLPAIDPSYGH